MHCSITVDHSDKCNLDHILPLLHQRCGESKTCLPSQTHRVCNIWLLHKCPGFVRSYTTFKGTFKKYLCSRFPSFDTLLPSCSLLLVFKHPPKVHLFWLQLTLSPSISAHVKFREKKLIKGTTIFG